MFCYLSENTLIILAILIFNFISLDIFDNISASEKLVQNEVGFQLNITDSKHNKIVYICVK